MTKILKKGSVVQPVRQPDGGILVSVELPNNLGLKPTRGSEPKVAAWVGLTPKLLFTYGCKASRSGDPFASEVGIAGDYSYGWIVHARLAGARDTGEKPLQIPFMTLHYRTTQWIGPVPLVLSADVTYFYRISASGDLSIDTEQSTVGRYELGGHYETVSGWTPFNRNDSTTTRTPDSIDGYGRFKATIGTDLSFLLYDTIGLTGRIAPYLRLAVDAGKSAAGALMRLQLFIGIDLTGSFNFRLSIMGATLVKKDVPFPPTHKEWTLVDEKVPRRR